MDPEDMTDTLNSLMSARVPGKHAVLRRGRSRRYARDFLRNEPCLRAGAERRSPSLLDSRSHLGGRGVVQGRSLAEELADHFFDR